MLQQSIIDPCIDKVITSVRVDEHEVRIHFADGVTLYLTDDASHCCERRYMSTDDDLAPFVGSKFMGVEVREGYDRAFPYVFTEERGYVSTSHGYEDQHDVDFMLVTTSLGVFTCAAHNEHNGYYGGMDITASTVEK